MASYELLRELMELPGPTGQEHRVMSWLTERWTGRAERVWRTKVGNLLAHVGGQGPKLLITGHTDEIGFVVRGIDEHGFLWLASGQAGGQPRLRFPVGHPALVLGRGEPVGGSLPPPPATLSAKRSARAISPSPNSSSISASPRGRRRSPRGYTSARG